MPSVIPMSRSALLPWLIHGLMFTGSCDSHFRMSGSLSPLKSPTTVVRKLWTLEESGGSKPSAGAPMEMLAKPLVPSSGLTWKLLPLLRSTTIFERVVGLVASVLSRLAPSSTRRMSSRPSPSKSRMRAPTSLMSLWFVPGPRAMLPTVPAGELKGCGGAKPFPELIISAGTSEPWRRRTASIKPSPFWSRKRYLTRSPCCEASRVVGVGVPQSAAFAGPEGTCFWLTATRLLFREPPRLRRSVTRSPSRSRPKVLHPASGLGSKLMPKGALYADCSTVQGNSGSQST